jgi:micrococcal nuclease
MTPRFAAGLAAFFLYAQAWGASFDGTVTHVTDGDTLWVRPASGGAPRELRLDGIDAPEACQPHGPEAREALVRRVTGQSVRVSWSRRDTYGRLVARVELQGQDINAWLVQQGHAWAPRWRRQEGPYAADQRRARQARRGLWGERAPMEPRVFRQFHGNCASQGS